MDATLGTTPAPRETSAAANERLHRASARGVCLHALVVVPPPTAPPLTPQQHALFLLVQDLAQATTGEEARQVLARIGQVLHPLHPQPRPQTEPLLPRVAPPATCPVAL